MNNNLTAKEMCLNGGSFLDSNNILWKWFGGEWMGKRSVLGSDNRVVWMEETEDVKKYWCGKDADYNEIFK